MRLRAERTLEPRGRHLDAVLVEVGAQRLGDAFAQRVVDTLRVVDVDAEPRRGEQLDRENLRRFEGHLRRELERALIHRTESLPPSRPLAEFDRALTLDPYNVQALYGRGLIYQADKHHEQAIADFTAANGLTPQRVEPLLARATSYLAIDKAKEAASDLDEAVQADPNSAQAWSARGVTYERLGDKAKAFTSYSRALALRPRDEAARSGLARNGG